MTTLPSHQTAEAYDTLGVLYAQQRQLRCAIPAFEQAIKLNPRDWRTRYNFAVALADGGETKRAIEQLQILLRQNPDSAAAHNMLGSLLEKEGTLEAAADELKAALKRDPGLAPAALALAHILITQKRYSAALVYLDDALKSSPPAELEEQLRSAVAVAQAENGNFESAVETLGQVIKSHPDAADAYFNLATLYAKKGPSLGYEKAIANFQAALRIDPHYDEARYSMAKVLVEIGRFSEAPLLSERIHARSGSRR
jgi:protein O-GlcNAc transferase